MAPARRYLAASIVAAAAVAILWKLHPTVAHAEQSKSAPIARPAPVPEPSAPATAQEPSPQAPLPSDALDKVHALLQAARAKDRDAQFGIAKIMRSCPHFTHSDGTRMSFDEAIVPFRKYGTATDLDNVRRDFERCSRMWNAKDIGTAGEWLALATAAKQPQAMALTAGDLLWKMSSEARFRNALPGVNPEPVVTDPALDTTLDPRKLLREAVQSNNPDVYYAIAQDSLFLFPDDPDVHALYYSWMLVACQRGLDCSKTSDVAAFTCSRNAGVCDAFKDPSDYVLWIASNNNADMSLIETRAAEISAKLDAGQFDDLGL
jgi:hypothetical protein